MPIELEELGRGLPQKIIIVTFHSFFFISIIHFTSKREREKVQVSRLFEDLGRRTGIPKGLKQKWKIPEERGG